MEHQESSDEIFEKFTWKIENFSQFNNVDRIYSEPFILGGYPWRIFLRPKGIKNFGNLAIYLDAVQMQTDNVSKGWNRDVKFRLVVFNQLDINKTIRKGEYKNKFNASSNSWGYSDFIPLVEFRDPQKGFIVNNVCIVGVEVFVRECMPTSKSLVSKAASLTGYTNVEGQRPKQEVKDTNDEACCEDLQVLWEELEKYRPDLTWLEPHVQSALRIKNYVEKALQVEKLKKNVVDQELETKRLKTKLIAAEENLNIERDLLKAKGI